MAEEYFFPRKSNPVCKCREWGRALALARRIDHEYAECWEKEGRKPDVPDAGLSAYVRQRPIMPIWRISAGTWPLRTIPAWTRWLPAVSLQRPQSGECGRNHPYLCPDHSGLPDRAELAAVCRAYGELRLRPGRRQGLGAECAVSGTVGKGWREGGEGASYSEDAVDLWMNHLISQNVFCSQCRGKPKSWAKVDGKSSKSSFRRELHDEEGAIYLRKYCIMHAEA